jgi:hypothetical protein
MLTVIVGAVLIAVTLFIGLLIVLLKGKHMRNLSTELLSLFSKMGTEYNISFSSQEILNDCIIGLDGINRKLLVLKTNSSSYYDWFIIDLDEVQNCALQKTYKSIKAGELKKRSMEEYLEKINLRIDFQDHKSSVEICFYDQTYNKGYKVAELDRKAKNWEIMLSKMLKNKLKKIA